MNFTKFIKKYLSSSLILNNALRLRPKERVSCGFAKELYLHSLSYIIISYIIPWFRQTFQNTFLEKHL